MLTYYRQSSAPHPLVFRWHLIFFYYYYFSICLSIDGLKRTNLKDKNQNETSPSLGVECTLLLVKKSFKKFFFPIFNNSLSSKKVHQVSFLVAWVICMYVLFSSANFKSWPWEQSCWFLMQARNKVPNPGSPLYPNPGSPPYPNPGNISQTLGELWHN